MLVENEYRVIGPPGCGKTTYLADQVQKRVAKWCEDTGNHSMQCNDVLLASLTRTAAAEIRSRGLAIPAEQVGTLHAHALRALGKPKLCVSPKAIGDWNKESPMEFWRSEGASAMAEEGISLGKYNGDALFSEYTTNRCRLTPREQWRGPVLEFAKAYESWKYRNDYLDYDDLIIRAYEDDTDPPGNPSTILGDEQQDSSAAEFRLMRHWATKINKLILVGDADQSIFQFRGGDPDGMFSSEVPDEHEKVLEQSYRVPRAVHAEAMRVIERVSHRKPVIYYPRDEEGEVERTCWSMRTAPYEAVEQIERLLNEPDERPGTPKAMCIFSCAYQANALMAALRSAGIPYWNPYARERGNFNPLHPAKGVSTLDRILDYLRSSEACHGDAAAVWTWEQFQNWTEMCSSDGWLRHGAKAEVKRRASATPSAQMKVDEIQALISHEDVLDDLAECSLEWLGQHIAETKKGVYSYVMDIAKKRGWLEVKNNPRVVVGTGHCSPPDEPVLTVDGYIPIGQLNPEKHRLCGFNYKTNDITWGGRGPALTSLKCGRRGFAFDVGSRQYSGDLITIKTEKSKTRVTPCHRVRVRMNHSYYRKWVVYLMRRGKWWRIGLSSTGSLKTQNTVGPACRLSAEMGDGAWILGIYNEKRKAVLAESFAQAKYGIPGIIFNRTHDDVSGFYDSFGDELDRRADLALRDYGLLRDVPLFDRSGKKRCGYSFETAAANVISGFMDMPVLPDGFGVLSGHTPPEWLAASVKKDKYDGLVYSLNVHPNEHYVSGGAVVHNSIKGAEAENVFVCPDLSVSGWENYGDRDGRDSIFRLYYVALTRARRRLILTAPSCPQAIDL